MKTDIDIKDDVYRILVDSPLKDAIKGTISKDPRGDSTAEDIVIDILANQNGEIQESYVNVNIYVSDLYDRKTKTYKEDRIRLRELCRLSSEVLESNFGDCFWMKMQSQRVFREDTTHQRFINNKLLYKSLN